MSNNEQEYRIVNGKKVPVMSAKGTITIKNKRTGAVYQHKAHFDEDVANPETDTKDEDFRKPRKNINRANWINSLTR